MQLESAFVRLLTNASIVCCNWSQRLHVDCHAMLFFHMMWDLPLSRPELYSTAKVMP
jgi:hypothetical protein